MYSVVCIGCIGRWVCWKHWNVWGRRRCFIHRPVWNHCCHRITDPICVIQNGLCHALRAIVLAGLRVARFLVEKSKHILDAVVVVLRGAQHVVNLSKKSLDLVIHILEGVKILFKAGVAALNAIVSFGLGGIFDIRELAFDVALSTAATGHFRVSILVSIFNHLKRFSLDINLNNILSFVKKIGEQVIHGLKKFFS